MESDLKRGDASRKSFRVPAKSRQAPIPPTKPSSHVAMQSTAAATTPIRLYNTSMSPSLSSAVDKTVATPAITTVATGMRLKTFAPIGCVAGSDANQKPLKLADILRPSGGIAPSHNGNTSKTYTSATADATKSTGAETSLDVLKDLEKRINRIEMNEKLKQSINGRTAIADGGKLVQIKNQYADRENLTKAGLDSSSTLSAGLDQTSENETSFFQRNSVERSSIGGTIALKAIIDTKPTNDGGAFTSTKPVSRTVSDTKTAENSALKLRLNYMQKQLHERQLQKQPAIQQNNSTAAIVVNSREHISSFAGSKNGPLSPLTSKKKENTIVVDKTKLATSTIVDSSRSTNTSKLSHSSSLKRETLRHPITAMATATTPTERSVKLNKKHLQVIWIWCVLLLLPSSKITEKKISWPICDCLCGSGTEKVQR